MACKTDVLEKPLITDTGPDGHCQFAAGKGFHTYMTTEESATYMRKSASWLLRQKDIPYYRGKPNLYKRTDLDNWMDNNRRYEPIGYYKEG